MATLWNSSTNTTGNASSGGYPTPRIFEGVSLAILIFTSLVLNFAVGFVIWQHKHLRRRTTNVFILNLVISNVFMSVFVMPFSLHALLKQAWMLSGILCTLNGISSTTLFVASIYTLCSISVDRYYAVVRPMRYKHVLTPRRSLYILLGIWVGALTCACVPLFGFSQYKFHPGTCHCSPSLINGCGFYMFMSTVGFIVPVLILLVTYGLMFSKLRQHTKRVSTWSKSGSRRHHRLSGVDDRIEKFETVSNVSEAPRRLSFAAEEKSTTSDVFHSHSVGCGQESNKGERNILELVPYVDPATPNPTPVHLGMLLKFKNRVRRMKRVGSLSQEYKIAKTGLILVIVFFVSWGPYMMVNNCRLRKIATLSVFRTAMWLAYFSCVLNPMAYALYSRNIRAAFSRKFNCCRGSRRARCTAATEKRA